MTGYPNPLPPTRAPRGRGRFAVAALVVTPLAILTMLGVRAETHHRKSPPPVAAPQPSAPASPQPPGLPDLLVSAQEVADIVGVVDMAVSAAAPQLISMSEYGVTVDRAECNAVWYPALQDTYGATGFSATYSRLLHSRAEHPPYIVLESLVEYPDDRGSRATYEKLVPQWQGCAEQSVVVTGQEGAVNFGALTSTDDTVALTVVGAAGLGCQRVMRVQRNVISDIQVCRPDVADQAVAIADRISAKISH